MGHHIRELQELRSKGLAAPAVVRGAKYRPAEAELAWGLKYHEEALVAEAAKCVEVYEPYTLGTVVR